MALPEIKNTMDLVEVYHHCWQAQQLQQRLAAQVKQHSLNPGLDAKHLTALALSHSDAMAPIPDQLKCSPQSSILATKVLGTTELFENIFSNLEACDIFSACSINKRTKEIVEGSSPLQCELGLQARESHVAGSIPMSSINLGWSFSIDGWSTTTREYVVSPTVKILQQASQMGSRLRAALVCQPPTQSMSVFLRCCPHEAPVDEGLFFIRSGEYEYKTVPAETIHAQPGTVGVTIGDIDIVARRIQSQHRLCPHATAEDHDKQGFVIFEPVFKTHFFPPGSDCEEETNPGQGFMGCFGGLLDYMARKTLHEFQIEAYVKAKQEGNVCLDYEALTPRVRAAWEDENNIPTFAEFLDKEGPALGERY